MSGGNLNLPGEGFALVGEKSKAEPCRDCGRADVLLVSGRCETCINEANQAFIIAQARQRTFFNENDCGGVFDGFGVVSDADPGL